MQIPPICNPNRAGDAPDATHFVVRNARSGRAWPSEAGQGVALGGRYPTLMDVSAASLSLPALYAFMGQAVPAAASPEVAQIGIALEKKALEAAGSMALQLLGSLPATSGVDLATAMASLQQVQPAAALATLAAG
jgi:hypothetical protein